MVKVIFLGYAGERLETKQASDRADALRQLAEYPGAGSAVIEGPRGVETVGRGAAFVAVDGNARQRRPLWKDLRPSYRNPRVRQASSWYGASALA